MFHSRAAQRTVLTCSAFAFMMAALGDHSRAGGNLDASYTISFARIRVGDITATVEFGDNEYAISARGRAGGIMKLLMEGEGSFSTRGTIKDGHLVPTTFTSKIVSGPEMSDVTMVLDEGTVKELAAAPPPSSDRVPVTDANRQGIVDPLTAMLFSAAAAGDGLSQEACRHSLPIFDGRQRYDLKLAFKRMARAPRRQDFETRALRLPDSKTGTKTVHLGQPAFDVLEAIKQIEENPWVITGTLPGAPLHDLQPFWQRVRARAGHKDVRIHDLRHTFASTAVTNGHGLPR